MVTPAQDSCQRWLDGRHSWRHPSDGGFDARRFAVVELPKQTAKRFVTSHHYAGDMPASRRCYGLVTDDATLAVDGTEVNGLALVGAAALSVPMRADVLTGVFPDLEPYEESLELGRLVLTDTPANAETWFLGQLAEQETARGLRGLLAFSDPVERRRVVVDVDDDGRAVERAEAFMPGHVGMIYQAFNGYACGRSTARTLTYLPRHGLVVSDRTLQKVRAQERGAAGAERRLTGMGARAPRAGERPAEWLAAALVDLGAVKVRHPGNYRYAWRLGTRTDRRKVIPLPRTAYPKPATGRAVHVPVHPATEQLTLIPA